MARFEVELGLWYGTVMTIVVVRFLARGLFLGSIKKVQLEDYIMFVNVIFFTSLLALLVISNHYPTNLVPPDLLASIQADEVPRMIIGSKLVIVIEQLWCATIWGCKACLLLHYYRMTKGVKQQMRVKIVASWAVFGYLIMQVFFFGVWCKPFYNYWSVPSANFQCDTYHHHLILNLIVNVSSDIMMLCIPLPILYGVQLPLRKKIILCCLFGIGVFVILCAGMSKFYSLKYPYGKEWINWYVREVSVAVIVANIPHCWLWLQKAFNLDEFLDSGWDGRRFFRRTPTPSTNDNMVGTNAGTQVKTRKRLRKRMPNSGIPTNISQEQFVEYETENGVHLEVLDDGRIMGTEFSAGDKSEGDMPQPDITDAASFV